MSHCDVENGVFAMGSGCGGGSVECMRSGITIFLSPLRGWVFLAFTPRLAPWAAFFRRFAAWAGVMRSDVPTGRVRGLGLTPALRATVNRASGAFQAITVR